MEDEATCLPFINRPKAQNPPPPLQLPLLVGVCTPSAWCPEKTFSCVPQCSGASAVPPAWAPSLHHLQALANVHIYLKQNKTKPLLFDLPKHRLDTPSEWAWKKTCFPSVGFTTHMYKASCRLTMLECLFHSTCPSGMGYLLYKGIEKELPESPSGLFQLLGTSVLYISVQAV